MDSNNDPNLVLNELGVCNHCISYDEAYKLLPNDDLKLRSLHRIVKEIKDSNTNEKYDAVLGVSGGVDSTYLAFIAKKLGLRLLLVHCDNGWNSELSVKNIEGIIKNTGFDLHTHVLDWEEFRDIQLSFFKAGVVDIELPYDYALIVLMYQIAEKYKIKNVLSGHNLVTEGTYLPKSWVHSKVDIINIKAIHKQFGRVPMKTFPHMSVLKWIYATRNRSKSYRLLDYVDYNKAEAKATIIKEFGWRDYGGKHYESIFTRFYQGYILPEKFKIDKRQYHLSTLICSGQITREEALAEFAKPKYDEAQLKMDKEYVIKKLGFTEQSFDEYMKAPIHKHSDYPNIQQFWDRYFKVIKVFKPFIKPIKTLLGK
ncbi:MAG: N-acetyl sugar amidotransferase [Bacteroidetes bacterium]|nr:N-acetyl sugar amidotransferase [Bacteroidota bacterium]